MLRKELKEREETAMTEILARANVILATNTGKRNVSISSFKDIKSNYWQL